MDLELWHLVVTTVIGAGGFFGFSGTVLYKLGRRDQELTELKRDLNGLGEKVSQTVTKTDSVIKDLYEKVNSLTVNMGKAQTTLDYIKEQLSAK